MNWQCPDRLPELSKGALHIWRWDITDLDEPETPQLSAAEFERLARFKVAAPRREFLFGRILLRRLLGAYLQRPAPDIELTLSDRGKPFLADGHFHFNLSHTRGRVMVALCPDAEIGVDVQFVDRKRSVLDLCERYYSAAEQQEVAEGDPFHAFFRVWTRKEAFLKATGHGISTELSAIDTTPGMIGGYRLRSFTDEPGDAEAAVAFIDGTVREIQAWSANTWQPVAD